MTERIARLTATPWSTRDKSDVTVSFKDAPTTSEVPTACRINYRDLVNHGFTDGCPQCDHNAKFMKSKGGVTHTEKCRIRFLDALMATPDGACTI